MERDHEILKLNEKCDLLIQQSNQRVINDETMQMKYENAIRRIEINHVTEIRRIDHDHSEKLEMIEQQQRKTNSELEEYQKLSSELSIELNNAQLSISSIQMNMEKDRSQLKQRNDHLEQLLADSQATIQSIKEESKTLLQSKDQGNLHNLLLEQALTIEFRNLQTTNHVRRENRTC
jgi:uncharacterized protein (UPF0210 family)